MGGNDLVIDGVGTCVEGEVFGVLSSLYEEWRSCPYKDAPGLDPDFEWSEEADYLELLGDDFAAEEDEYYGVDAFDTQCGDIIEKYLAKSGCEGNFEERKKELTAIFFSFNFLWAVTLCVKNGNCNTLLLEKEMCIGYGKTMAIIDAMEAFRLVQPFYVTGNKNRKVLPLAIEFLLHRAKQAFEVLKTFFEKVLLDKGKLSDFVDGYSLAELRKEAYMLCACLTPRQMECLEMRYGLKDGVCRSIDEVGRYFGVTRERVRQIEAKAFKKLLKIFNSSYKHSSDSSPAESSGKG